MNPHTQQLRRRPQPAGEGVRPVQLGRAGPAADAGQPAYDLGDGHQPTQPASTSCSPPARTPRRCCAASWPQRAEPDHLAEHVEQIYALLEQYSPEFTCLFGGLNNLRRTTRARSSSTTRSSCGPRRTRTSSRTRATSRVSSRGSSAGYGPNCFGLPDNPQPRDANGNFQIPGKYRCINDGAPLTDDPCAGGSTKSTTSTRTASDTVALGSPAENQLVNTLIAGSLHTTPDKVPGIATMLAAPLYRGAEVTLK